MPWSAQFSLPTSAPPQSIWNLWKDVAAWTRWDHEVEKCALDGAFAVGTRGTLKPKGGPTTRFEIVELEALKRFTNRSLLPLCRLEFIHTLSTLGEQTVVEHRVQMNGPLTFLFRRLIGTSIEKGLPQTVFQLVAMAEETRAA